MHQRIKNLYKESLFRNSFFLMMSTSAQAVIGFLFWFICARLFNPSDVGFATSLISAASLTSVFSMLGFNNVIVRFLPNSNKKDQQLSTAFILTALASFVAAGIFLLGSFTTHSKIVHTDHQLFLIIIFTLYVLAITVNSIAESAFIAYRSTAYILTKNIFFSVLKVLALFLVAALGALGIVGVTMAALFFTLALSYYWLTKKFNYRPVLGIDRTTIAETKHFAIGNYFGTLFGVLPSTTLTLIIFSRL
ncbi:MAG TPA: oligosaccharide flippase family protein, partial [Candidatus Paceibacterota bacterium]|nr:oligosaccharide flippase family protein [Candidatus Paceibacterota bacterium]